MGSHLSDSTATYTFKAFSAVSGRLCARRWKIFAKKSFIRETQAGIIAAMDERFVGAVVCWLNVNDNNSSFPLRPKSAIVCVQ